MSFIMRFRILRTTSFSLLSAGFQDSGVLNVKATLVSERVFPARSSPLSHRLLYHVCSLRSASSSLNGTWSDRCAKGKGRLCCCTVSWVPNFTCVILAWEFLTPFQVQEPDFLNTSRLKCLIVLGRKVFLATWSITLLSAYFLFSVLHLSSTTRRAV